MYLYPAGYRLLLRTSGKAEMQEPENWLKGGAMIKVIDNKIYRRQDKELLVIEPWGPDSLRVRATQNHTFNKDEETSALLPALASAPEITTDGKSAVITNGKIRCELMVTGKLKFSTRRVSCYWRNMTGTVSVKMWKGNSTARWKSAPVPSHPLWERKTLN